MFANIILFSVIFTVYIGCDFQRTNHAPLWLLQVPIPDNYRLWYETMLAEFPTRFQQLFAGPMWSGAAKDDIRNPLKVSQD